MLRLVPIYLKPAKAYLARVHRHHPDVTGYRIAVAVADSNGVLHGVAIAGRPVNRNLDDGHTIEISRVATDGAPNACSMLYGACWRAARAIGYTRGTTYTQDGETGASLRASGWMLAADLRARSGWDTPSRHRAPGDVDEIDRNRWEIRTPGYADAVPVLPEELVDDDAQMVLDLFEVAA